MRTSQVAQDRLVRRLLRDYIAPYMLRPGTDIMQHHERTQEDSDADQAAIVPPSSIQQSRVVQDVAVAG
ncbi:hypothetical protein LTR95_015237 [Oleoguttula sp. CCFEE 5521]